MVARFGYYLKIEISILAPHGARLRLSIPTNTPQVEKRNPPRSCLADFIFFKEIECELILHVVS